MLPLGRCRLRHRDKVCINLERNVSLFADCLYYCLTKVCPHTCITTHQSVWRRFVLPFSSRWSLHFSTISINMLLTLYGWHSVNVHLVEYFLFENIFRRNILESGKCLTFFPSQYITVVPRINMMFYINM